MKKSALLCLLSLLACLSIWMLTGSGREKTTAADRTATETGPKTAVEKNAHPAAGVVPSPSSAPPPPVSARGDFWSFGKETAGDAAGLTGKTAAESRGNSILPAGRRFRLADFPDIRTLEEGKRVDVSLPDGRTFEGRVNWSKRDDGYPDLYQVSIGFKGDMGGLVATNDGTTGLTQGRLLVEHDPIAWTLEPDKTGGLWLVEHLREDMICERPNPQAARSSELPGDTGVTGTGTVAPALNSRSSASAVLYIDFDGQATQTYPDWPASNPGGVPLIDPHSGMTADQMTLVWRRVAEDYIQFNINVTTDPAKYTAATPGSRMRILVGASLSAGVNGAGLAYVTSFRSNAVSGISFSSNVPCWLEVSPNYGNPSTMTDGQFSSLASNISHEFGHTLGLFHDGNDGKQPTAAGGGGNYYPGHGTAPFDWSPIMGGPYRSGSTARSIIQWSKNDYPGANNSQDDLAIISGTANGFGYVTDESTSFISASTLTTIGTDQVGGGGIIANNSDSDWWQFQTTHAGATVVTVEPADRSVSLPDLDCGFRIEDATGATVAGPFATQDNLTAKATFTLGVGTFYVVAYGTGNRQFSDSTGYNNYGSTGRYLVTVDLPPDVTAPVATVDSPADNSFVTAPGTFDFHGTATDNESVTGLSIYLRRDADNAWWNGTYWQVSATGAGLARTYNGTTQAWACTSPLPAVGGNSANSIHGGNYAFIVIAEDAAGHSTQIGSDVTVQLPGPNVAIQNPGQNSVIDGFTSIYGTATDTGGGIAGNSVNLLLSQVSSGKYWNGSTWVSSPTSISIPVNGSTWAYGGLLPGNATNELAGLYTMSVSTLDNYGISSVPQSGVNNIIFTVDTAPPVVSISSPADGSTITTASYTMAGSANDTNGVQGVSCFVRRGSDSQYWNGSGWGSTAVGIPTSYDAQSHQWTCTGSLPQPGGQLANGNYNFIAIATDTSGHHAQIDSVVTVDYHPIYTWTGATLRDASPNNDSQDWATSENWSPNGVPGAGDIAIIANGDEVRSSTSRTVYGMNLISGRLTFTSGAGPSGTLTSTKTAVWKDGTLSGLWSIPADSTLDLMEGAIKLLIPGSSLNNAGTINWLGGYLRDNGSGGVAVNNLAGGTFNLATDGSPFEDYYSGNTFNNAGTFTRSAGTAPALIRSWTFNNTGTIRCDVSVLRFEGALNLNAGSTFSGTSPINLNSTTTVNAAVTLPGNVSLTGGILNCPGGVTLGGDVQWLDGTLNGRMEISAGSRLTLATGTIKSLTPGSVINNSGTILWTGDSGYFRDNGSGGVVINNQVGGIFKMTGDGSPFEDLYSGNTFNNAGTFIRSAGTTVMSIHSWTFNNTGAIRCDAGGLRFDTALNLNAGSTLGGTSAINLNSTTTVTAAVTFPATVSLTAGVLNCPGGVPISGDFQWLDGTLNGRMDLPSGSRLTLATGGIKLLTPGSVINNSGTIVWGSDSGYFRDNGSGGVVINNQAGGVFKMTGEGSPFEDYYGGNTFNNAGTLIRTGGTSTMSIHAWTFNNTGLIQCDATAALQLDSLLNLNAGSSFAGTGPIRLNSTTFLNVPINISSTVSLTGGGLNLPSTGVTVSGYFQWQDGYINGRLDIPAGSSLVLGTDNLKLMTPGSVINNAGTVTWNGGNAYFRDTGSGGCTINNLVGGTFIAAGDGLVFENLYGGNVFNNAGTFVRQSGTALLSIHSWAFNNSGTIRCDASTLRFDSALALNAGTTLVANSPIALNGTTTVNDSSVLLTGNVSLTGGSFNTANGVSASLVGNVTWSGGYMNGTLNVQSAGTLNLSGTDIKELTPGSVINNSGTMNWNAGASYLRDTGNGGVVINNLSGASFNLLSDGSPFEDLYGGNAFNNAGTFVKSGGTGSAIVHSWTFRNTGTIAASTGDIVFNGGAVELKSGGLLTGAKTIHFTAGTVSLQGTTSASSGHPVMEGAALTGNADATGTLAGPWVWTSGYFYGIVKIAANGTLALPGTDARYLGNGSLLENSGTVTVTDTGNLRGEGDSTIRNKAGAIFNAAGTATFSNYYPNNNFVNEGAVTIGSPTSQWSLEWNFTQSSTGVLALDIAGPAATDFDRLNVAGTATLGGTVAVTKLGGYVPAQGVTFAFLNAGAGVSGTFATVNGGFNATYAATSATLAPTAGLTFESWIATFGLTGSDALPNGDPDHDGMTNFVEYAFNTNPTTAGATVSNVAVTNISGQNWLVLKYRRWTDRETTGLVYTPQSSTTLATWTTTAPMVVDEDTTAPVIAGSTAWRCRVPVTAGKSFLRVRVTRP